MYLDYSKARNEEEERKNYINKVGQVLLGLGLIGRRSGRLLCLRLNCAGLPIGLRIEQRRRPSALLNV